MIRKQIYVARHHDRLLKRLAREQKVSEAELIRDALDRHAESASVLPSVPDDAAWSDALRLMHRLAGRRARRRPPFRREQAYAERLRRWR